MSPVSKIVFGDKSKADGFAATCGGEVADYSQSLQAAKASVAKENKMINGRRLKKGQNRRTCGKRYLRGLRHVPGPLSLRQMPD
jgi:hypothetical protein